MSAPSSDLPPSVRFLGIDRNRARFNPELRAIIDEQERVAQERIDAEREAERKATEEAEARRASRAATAAIRNETEAKAKAREEAKEARREYADDLISEQMKIAKETPGAQSFYTTVVIDDPTDVKYENNSKSRAGEVTIKGESRPIRSGVPEVTYSAVYSDERLNIPFQSRIVGGRNIPIRIGDIVNKEAAKAQRGEPSLYAARTVYDMDAVRTHLDTYQPARQNVRYIVNLEDNIGLNGPAEKTGQTVVYEGSTPYLTAPEGGFFEGAAAVGKNLVEFGASGAGVVREAKYEPEAEASAFGAIFGFGRRVAEGQGLGMAGLMAAKEFGEIGQAVQKNPLYFAGSIAASAALWLFPYSKVASLARTGITGLRVGRALSPLGDIARVERGLVNIGKESDPFRYAVGQVTKVGKQPAVEFFLRETPQKVKPAEMLVSTKRITGYTRPAAMVNTKAGETLVDVGKVPKGYSGEDFVKVGSEIFEKADLGRGPVYLRVPQTQKPVAVSETFTFGELSKLLRTEGGVNRFLGIGKEFKFTSIAPSSAPKIRPSTISAPTVTAEYLKNVGVLPSAPRAGAPFGAAIVAPESVAKASTEAAKEANKVYETPGIMGGGRRVEVEDMTQYYNTPAQSPFSGSKIRPTTTSEQGLKSDARIYNDLVYGPIVKTGLKLDPLRGLNTTPFFVPIESPTTTPITTPLTTPVTVPITTPITTPIETSVNVPDIPAPRPPRTPRPFLIPVTETKTPKRRKMSYGAYEKGLTVWKVPPILKLNTGELDKIFGLGQKRKGKKAF